MPNESFEAEVISEEVITEEFEAKEDDNSENKETESKECEGEKEEDCKFEEASDDSEEHEATDSKECEAEEEPEDSEDKKETEAKEDDEDSEEDKDSEEYASEDFKEDSDESEEEFTEDKSDVETECSKFEQITESIVENVEAEVETVETFSNPTVEVDGEQLDVQAVFAKYQELKVKYNELYASVKSQQIAELKEFGKNFVMSDKVVDSETKENYIKQINEKCDADEFASEEEVKNFAKTLMAMYYYENSQISEQKDSHEELYVHIQKEEAVQKKSKCADLKDSIQKLNEIN